MPMKDPKMQAPDSTRLFAQKLASSRASDGYRGCSCADVCAGAFLVIAVSAPDRQFHGRLIRSRFLRFFGKYSYCLYVCHQPLIYLLASAGLTRAAGAARLHSAWAALLLINCVAFARSITIALLSWHLFEKRFLGLKERLANDSRVPAPADLGQRLAPPRVA